MPAYRVFETDGSTHVRSAEVIEAQTDQEAMQAAKTVLNDRAGELWLADKMICRFGRSMDTET